jgi:hypothetical protein
LKSSAGCGDYVANVVKVPAEALAKYDLSSRSARTAERLGERVAARLLALVVEGNDEGAALLASLKRDQGAVGLDSLLMEIIKLTAVRQLGLPEGLFAGCSEKLVAAWRARAIKMYPSDFRDANEDVRITLLAALCSSRQAEITDALVELLVALVHKINARAERRVEKKLTAELKKVRGKEGILFKLADAAISRAWQSGRLDLVEEGEGFGGVRAHEAFQTSHRDVRPPAGPCPHLFLEGADGLVQISRAGGGGDGLGEFGAFQHREVRAHPQRGHQVGGVAQ